MTEPVLHQPDNLTRRVSDAERARAASAVDAAVADGRLTWTEHSERYGQIWAAQTRGELTAPLADLGPVSLDLPQVQRVVAVCSKVSLAPGTVEIVSGDRDLFALVDDQRVSILYPERSGYTVIDEGEVFLAKRVAMRTAPPPGGPVVRLTGKSSFGHLTVHRVAKQEPAHFDRMLEQPGPVELHLHQDRHLHLHQGPPGPLRFGDLRDRGYRRQFKQNLKQQYKRNKGTFGWGYDPFHDHPGHDRYW